MIQIKKVQCINGADIPNTDGMREDLENMGISANDGGLYCVDNDGEPFAEWLKEIGFKFEQTTFTWIGIWGT